MAKAKEVYASGESPASSQKLNRQINDYLARGQLILSSTGMTLSTTTTGAVAIAPQTATSWVSLGWYPYNPAKQIYDRMDIIFNHHVSGTAADLHLQYSLDSGATWVDANPGQSVSPLVIRLPLVINGGTSLGPSVRTVDISGIGAAGYIGFRLFVDVQQEVYCWFATAFLYLSTDTPF